MKNPIIKYVFIGLAFVIVLLLFIPTSYKPGERPGPKVIVLGDSLSAGYNVPREEAYPEKMNSLLDREGIQVNIINAGVSGDTTQGGLNRLGGIISQKPAGVIVQLGANDMLRQLPVEETRKNLEQILEKLSEHKIRVLLMGMKAAPNYNPGYQEEFNSIYTQLAKNYDVDFYPFFLDGVAGVPEYNLDDGVHPNMKGIEVMVRNSYHTVADFVKELQ